MKYVNFELEDYKKLKFSEIPDIILDAIEDRLGD